MCWKIFSGNKSDKKGNKSEDTIKAETILTKANTGQTKPSVSVGVVPGNKIC